MWKLHLSWDEPVSDEIANKWKSFQKNLHLTRQLKVQGFVLTPDINYIDICAFVMPLRKAIVQQFVFSIT
ncbi:hypothetical protein X975_00210, partial [Stegodyphus mimosarum]